MINRFLSALALATVTALSTQGTAIAETGARAQQSGKKIYRRHCVHCHGGQLKRFAQMDQQTFNKIIIDGSNLMPGFDAKLNQTELKALWTYLNTQASAH